MLAVAKAHPAGRSGTHRHTIETHTYTSTYRHIQRHIHKTPQQTHTADTQIYIYIHICTQTYTQTTDVLTPKYTSLHRHTTYTHIKPIKIPHTHIYTPVCTHTQMHMLLLALSVIRCLWPGGGTGGHCERLPSFRSESPSLSGLAKNLTMGPRDAPWLGQVGGHTQQCSRLPGYFALWDVHPGV